MLFVSGRHEQQRRSTNKRGKRSASESESEKEFVLAKKAPNNTDAQSCPLCCVLSVCLRGVGQAELDRLNLTETTAVVLTADHGQNLGEFDMWSMMNLMDTSLRVPLIVRPAGQWANHTSHPSAPLSVYPHPVELVDMYPTTIRLAGFDSSQS